MNVLMIRYRLECIIHLKRKIKKKLCVQDSIKNTNNP